MMKYFKMLLALPTYVIATLLDQLTSKGSTTSLDLGNFNIIEKAHAGANGSSGSASGDGGDSGGGGTGDSGGDVSTPFLLTQTAGVFSFENDVLFGYPYTLFSSYEVGLAQYSRGISGDKYIIKNDFDISDTGNIKMQIREIEPEESYIDRIQLKACQIEDKAQLVPSIVFDNVKKFKFDEAYIPEQKIYKLTPAQKPQLIPNDYISENGCKKGTYLPKHSSISVEISVPALQQADGVEPFYLLISSHYRDWTLDHNVPFSSNELLWNTYLPKVKSKIATFGTLSLAALVGVFAVYNNDLSHKNIIETHNLIQTVNADTVDPRCLTIFAVVGDKIFDLGVAYPRYAQSNLEYVQIPDEVLEYALSNHESLVIQVTATKNHYVQSLSIRQMKSEEPVFTDLELVSVILDRESRDYAKELGEDNSTFLHTYPGDTVHLEFNMSQDVKNIENLVFMIEMDGFYVPMTKDVYADQGGWYNQLDSESKKILSILKRNSVQVGLG